VVTVLDRDDDGVGDMATDGGGGGQLDDTLYEPQRLLSNGKLPQRFLEKIISDGEITVVLEPLRRPVVEWRLAGAVLPFATIVAAANTPSQPRRASSSSSTPETVATISGDRRLVRFGGAALSSTDPPASGRTRRRRRKGRNNRSRSQNRNSRPVPPLPPPSGNDYGDDSSAERSCGSSCSSSSTSRCTGYRLTGLTAAAKIPYVPYDVIAYAKQQATWPLLTDRSVGEPRPVASINRTL